MSNDEQYRKSRPIADVTAAVIEADPSVLVPAYKLILRLQKENASLNQQCGQMKVGINMAKQRMTRVNDLERQIERLKRENCELVNRINDVMTGRAFPVENIEPS